MFNNLIKIKKTHHYQQFIKLQRNLSSKTDSPIDQCLNNLRRLDHSSVLQIPFYPKDVRSAFVAIKSLNLELLSIPNSISSGKTLIGQMRYQWWRDAINSCYKEDNEESQAPINHPVILALHPVIKRHKLSKYHFNRLIDARETSYLNPKFNTIEDLIKYSQSTNFSILSLLLQSLNLSNTAKLPLSKIDHALSHLSNHLTISTILHSLPSYYKSRSNVSILPLDLMICSEEELFKVAHSSNLINETILERVQQTIMKIFDLSLSELNACRATLMDQEHHHSNLFNQALPPTYLDPSIRPLFLSATPAKTYLNRLEKLNFDAFHPSLQTRDWKLPFQIWSDSFFGKL
ncbi:Squalene/phytoene synthase [Melampsora americana]|nr:Squalene/phytoene synthase [Melampsora americana]